MTQTTEPLPESIWLLVARAAEAVKRLVVQHVHLATVELERDTKGLSTEVGIGVISLPLLAVGYVFLGLAAAVALSPWLGDAGAVAVIGLVNVIAGGIAMTFAVRRLRKRQFLDDTRAQVKASAARLAASFQSHPVEEVLDVR